ncbi:ankyrin repeat-containing domain protein [Cladorrhinum sp. PSN259]|nr:ankyrin repeat-containing domain protein [Cladorrhinum sp. PSN259]
MKTLPVDESSSGHTKSPLHAAASKGDIKLLQKLLSSGTVANIEERGADGRTPLLEAADSGKTEAIRFLLDSGADATAADNEGQTALHYAVYRNQRINVSLLLEYGARSVIDWKSKLGTRSTVLGLASSKGYFDVLKLLLDSGDCDVLCQNDAGFNPLHLAVGAPPPTTVDARVVRELVERGCDVEARDGSGETALEVVKRRVEAGEEIDGEVLTVLSEGREARMERLTRRLLVAAEYGRSREVGRLLERGVNVNCTNAAGQSALAFAAQGGHAAVVKFLLERGADVDHQDESGHTALWWAAFFGHEVVTKHLIEHEAQVDLADESGFTPLSAAARKGREKAAELLIQAWAQVDIRDQLDRSPFIWAVEAGSLPIVELCLGESNWGDGEDYEHFNKALELADNCGHVEIAELLIEHGAEDAEDDEPESAADAAASQLEALDLNTAEVPEANDDNEVRIKDLGPDDPGYRETPLEIDWETDPTGLIHALTASKIARARRLLKTGIDATACRTKTGHTPLMEAAAGGHLDFVELLLDHGVNIEARNIKGQTALWQAAQLGKVKSVDLLLQKGADIEAQTYAGTSPLAAAAARGREAAVRLLVDKGAQLNSTDLKQQNALTNAVTFGHDAIVQFLLEKGMDFRHTDKWGLTPLHLAVIFNRRLILELLLKAGADVSARMGKDWHHQTALVYAAKIDAEAVTKLLIKHGANPDERIAKGRTAIHSAVLNGSSILVKLLIESGADVKAKDDAGITPLCAAKMRHDKRLDEVIKILSRASEIKKQAELARQNGSSRYKYHPISGDSCIRLLELHPGSGMELISFDLFEVDLDDEPVFEALSYEWGEGSRSIPVQCNNGYLLVTPNLKAVLRQLRRPDKSRLLWIDALCINQESIPERNQQVPFMTRIYRTAHKVNMWLGNSSSETEAGFKTVSFLLQVYETIAKQTPNFQNLPSKDVKLSEQTRTAVLKLWKDILDYEQAVDGLTDLFKRGYFTRAWIFQEIILAKGGSVLCGEYQCELPSWKKALYALDATQYYDILRSSFPEKDALIRELLSLADQTNRAIAIVNFLANLYHLNTRRELFTSAGILTTLYNLQSGDPRDKVYAAVGLLKPAEQEALAPDYSLTTQQVYIKAACHMFDMLKNPRIWGEYNRPHQKSISDLPSWVPDWSTPAKDQGLQSRTPSLSDFLPGDFITTDTTLQVTGYILDSVAYTVPISLSSDIYDHIVRPIALFLATRNISIFDPRPHPANTNPGKTNLSALWDMLISNYWQNDSSSSNPKVREAISYLAFKISTDTDLDIPERLTTSKNILDDDLVKDVDAWIARAEKGEKTYDHEICEWMDGVTWQENDIFVTERGGFGVSGGYQVTEEGMVVAILGGIEHLCLLRQKEEEGSWYEYVERGLVSFIDEEGLQSIKEEVMDNKERLEIQ